VILVEGVATVRAYLRAGLVDGLHLAQQPVLQRVPRLCLDFWERDLTQLVVAFISAAVIGLPGFEGIRSCTTMTTTNSFRVEVRKAKDHKFGNKMTVVKCHGNLVSETAGELKAVVKPLIPEGGRIILDVGDVNHVDSSGLGALVALKATAIKQGYCILELDNITPRVLDLLLITNLKQMFTGQAGHKG